MKRPVVEGDHKSSGKGVDTLADNKNMYSRPAGSLHSSGERREFFLPLKKKYFRATSMNQFIHKHIAKNMIGT